MSHLEGGEGCPSPSLKDTSTTTVNRNQMAGNNDGMIDNPSLSMMEIEEVS